MSQSFHLFQLQKVDSQLDQIQHRLEEIQAILAEDREVIEAEKQAKQAETVLKNARTNLHRLEDAVESKRIKKEQSEANLYAGRIKNPKELQDLQNEVASLKRAIAHLEDEQLGAMIDFESAEQASTAADTNLLRVQAARAEQTASLMGEQSQLTHARERLLSERSAILSQVQPDTLSTYERLRKNKRGTAVAKVSDGACDVCGAILTPAEQQAARSPNQMINCSSCGRILYSG